MQRNKVEIIGPYFSLQQRNTIKNVNMLLYTSNLNVHKRMHAWPLTIDYIATLSNIFFLRGEPTYATYNICFQLVRSRHQPQQTTIYTAK